MAKTKSMKSKEEIIADALSYSHVGTTEMDDPYLIAAFKRAMDEYAALVASQAQPPQMTDAEITFDEDEVLASMARSLYPDKGKRFSAFIVGAKFYKESQLNRLTKPQDNG